MKRIIVGILGCAIYQDYVVISSSYITYWRYIQGCGSGCWIRIRNIEKLGSGSIPPQIEITVYPQHFPNK